jgi:hemerythrin-like domain-containing protein
MSESKTPNIAQDLRLIHAVVTRSLQVAVDSSRSFVQKGYPDTSTREGFIAYVRSFVSVLHAHHQTEEEVAFPYFRDSFPDAPYDLLLVQHRFIASALDDVRGALEKAAAETQAGEPVNGLNQTLSRISGLWHPHIAIEEDHFTVEKAGALIGVEEHVKLGRMFMEHSQQHSGPDYLVVPFLLHNLPPGERAIFAASMPPVVTQELVPVLWKEKWAPMMPFLLP